MDSEWVVTLVAMGVLLVGVAGSMARAARSGAAWQSRVEEDWRRTAEALGASFSASALRKVAPRRLTLVYLAPEARVTATTNVPIDAGAPAHTRVASTFALGAGPAFRLWERNAREAFGIEREVLVDSALAARVRIDTDVALAVRAVLSEAACALLASFSRPLFLRSNGVSIELVWDGVELDGKVLADAILLVSELAASGIGPLRALSSIDGASWVGREDATPLVRVVRNRGEVDIEASPSPEGPIFFAHTTLQRTLAHFVVHIGAEGRVEGDLPIGALDPHDERCLSEVCACDLSCDGERIELRWQDAPTPAAAEAAVRLLIAMATGSGRTGAFR